MGRFKRSLLNSRDTPKQNIKSRCQNAVITTPVPALAAKTVQKNVARIWKKTVAAATCVTAARVAVRRSVANKIVCVLFYGYNDYKCAEFYNDYKCAIFKL